MKYIDEGVELKGKLVLVRAGLNVPVDSGRILDDFRIIKAVPTLQFLLDEGARVVVVSHIGRDGTLSLSEVASALREHVPTEFANTIADARNDARAGTVVVVENLRTDPREEENDEAFASELAEGFDIFVQDAFEVCHRAHASIVGVPTLLPSYGGLLLKAEVEALTEALEPTHPALFILGGGKLETKEPLLRKLLPLYDNVFIGGVLQNEILAARGLEIGRSAIEDGVVSFDILTTEKAYIVQDVLVERADRETATVPVAEVLPTDAIVDMGAATIDTLIPTLDTFKTIVWNGPMGWYERGYDEATVRLARALSGIRATTIVGGGDTVAVLEKEGLVDTFTFVSTGGGAMLQFLQNGTLPGVEALDEANSKSLVANSSKWR